MPVATVEDGTSFAPARATVPAHVEPDLDLPMHGPFEVRAGMAELYRGLGTREQIQNELDEISAHIRSFYTKAADEVLVECSAYTARITEICVLLHRVEGVDRNYLRVRTMQAEKYLAELDRQWKTASRLIEVQRQDLAMSGAQV